LDTAKDALRLAKVAHNSRILSGALPIGGLDDALAAGAKVCPTLRGSHSFSPATAVATQDGRVPIADIEVGDPVLGRDDSTFVTGASYVTAVWSHADTDLTDLVIDGESIETTPGHLFYVTGSGWTEAGELLIGDQIASLSGGWGTVEAVETRTSSAVMYDLTVAEVHTFFVGTGGWWVHNCSVGDMPSWVRSPGATVNWAKNIETAYKSHGHILTKTEIDRLVQTARQHNVDVIRLDPPHPGTPWDIPHLKIGDAHIPVPVGYSLP
jgi:hypothetical protein